MSSVGCCCSYKFITNCGIHFYLLKLHTIKFYKDVRVVKILEIAS